MATELMKEGTKVFQGLDATLKNIEAVKELSKITRTSLGPNGIVLLSLSQALRSHLGLSGL